ncbi:MAG: ArnT family glycosyltransferase [Acetivibrionales bacterium]|jgi:hypothetical protein
MAEIKDNNKSIHHYIGFAVILFVILMIIDLSNSHTGYFTPEGLKLAFIAVVGYTLVFILYLYTVKKLDTGFLSVAVILTGIFLRVCYMLYTGPGTRTYDVYREQWGHLDYIRYIADNLSLPPVNVCQAYHPPLHHIISAVALKLAKLLVSNEFLELKLVQAVTAILNIFTLITFYRMLKILKCSKGVILAGVSIFAFHPTNIYFSSRINNDNTMFFFYILAFYFLLRWINEKSLKNMVLLAVFSSLAVMAKLSGVMLIPVIASAFALSLANSFGDYKKYLKQFMVFCWIYLPLSLSYQIRNYFMFDQDFGYVPSFGRGFEPDFFNLVYIPVGNIIRNPFNNGGIEGGEFFLEFLLKSSLFGEWEFPGLESLALMLIILSVLNLIILFIYIILSRKRILYNHGYLFVLNLIIPFILAAKFRTDYPVACSQDFRYIAPVLISVSYFLGKAAGGHTAAGNSLKANAYVFRYITSGSVAAFCIASSVFVLMLSAYS